MKDFKFLGYANGWEEVPEEVIECNENDHEISHSYESNTVIVHLCEKCKFYYKVDSGD